MVFRQNTAAMTTLAEAREKAPQTSLESEKKAEEEAMAGALGFSALAYFGILGLGILTK